MDAPKKTRSRFIVTLMDTFGLSLAVAYVVAAILALIGAAAIYGVIRSAPPRTIVITSGPPGSTFQRFADAYQRGLAAHGVTLKIVPSHGSFENLERLRSTTERYDIGFVQGGQAQEGADLSGLVSLGSISYQPLLVFYRGSRITRLSELAGKRVGVGDVGSGTHTLALSLLQMNGITGDPGAPVKTTLVDIDAEAAATALTDGKLDAIFLMGDSAPLPILRTLIRSADIQLFDFTQADAYVRRSPTSYLNKMVLPMGSFDLGKNLPPQDVSLIGPTVELVARKGLHPALSDLLLDVAKEIHGKAGLLQRRGEFPAPLEHEFTLSDDALRYYKSGKGFLRRMVGSFWLATLINQVLVVFVPVLLVIIPTLRFLPIAYRWRNQLRIYRCYRPLLRLERDLSAPIADAKRDELLRKLDDIERSVNQLKVPASFADQFYELRGHIAFVRRRLKGETGLGLI